MCRCSATSGPRPHVLAHNLPNIFFSVAEALAWGSSKFIFTSSRRARASSSSFPSSRSRLRSLLILCLSSYSCFSSLAAISASLSMSLSSFWSCHYNCYSMDEIFSFSDEALSCISRETSLHSPLFLECILRSWEPCAASSSVDTCHCGFWPRSPIWRSFMARFKTAIFSNSGWRFPPSEGHRERYAVH